MEVGSKSRELKRQVTRIHKIHTTTFSDNCHSYDNIHSDQKMCTSFWLWVLGMCVWETCDNHFKPVLVGRQYGQEKQSICHGFSVNTRGGTQQQRWAPEGPSTLEILLTPLLPQSLRKVLGAGPHKLSSAVSFGKVGRKGGEAVEKTREPPTSNILQVLGTGIQTLLLKGRAFCLFAYLDSMPSRKN